jgi:ArsR family transcriptional regulator, lead/cadmium/zinc/bismuth-responsive transcriptional repressor
MTKDTAVCNVTCLHEDKVNRVKENLSDEHVNEVTALLKAVADQTRVKIISALTIEPELCVCDMANILNCSVASTSHHLRTLKKAGLTTTRKEGTTVYYKLSDHYMADFIMQAISQQKEKAL